MASKRAQRRKACDGKIRHTNRQNAFFALKAMNVANGMNVYKCKFCGGWHIGHWNRAKYKK